MKKIGMYSIGVLIALCVFLSPITDIITSKISDASAEKTNIKKPPYEKIEGKNSKDIITLASKTDLYKDGIDILNKEKFQLNGEKIAIRINGGNCCMGGSESGNSNPTNWAYFYVELNDGKKNQDDDFTKSFLAINYKENKSIIKLFYTSDQKGELISKTFENNKLISEISVDEKGIIQKGSYVLKDNQYFDVTLLNEKIKKEENNQQKFGTVQAGFSWSTFWNCLKNNGKNSLALRTQLTAACYYICLTGPASCITCTVINGGLTVGIASYCAYKAW